jgi:hypothetical protein
MKGRKRLEIGKSDYWMRRSWKCRNNYNLKTRLYKRHKNKFMGKVTKLNRLRLEELNGNCNLSNQKLKLLVRNYYLVVSLKMISKETWVKENKDRVMVLLQPDK